MATVRLTDRAVAAAKPAPGQRLELWDEVTPGLCLRVTEKGQKSFAYRYRTDDGRQPRLKLGDFSRTFGLAEARLAAERIRMQVRDGADPSGDRKRRRIEARAQPLKTFDDLADAFLEASEAGHWRPRNKKKRDRTVRDERAILGRHARPLLGQLRLEEIDRPMVRSLLRKMAARGIGAQTNRTHAVIRQVFAYAVAEERLAENPAAGLPPQVDEHPRERVLNDAELKGLWSALKRPDGLRKPRRKASEETVPVYVGPTLAIASRLCLLLLQRRNEIAGMRRDELDLERGVWTIPGVRMKGGVPHMVPLAPTAVELIRKAAALADARRPSADDPSPMPIFPSPRDVEKSIRPDSITHTIRDVMAALGFDNAAPHDLRRTGATFLVSERLGVSPFIVSRILAHRSDNGGAAAVTLAHYALHDFAPEKRRALEAWENELLAVVGERVRDENVTPLRARK